LLFLILVCLAWAVLFAVFLSHEWSHFSKIQKMAVVGLLSLYTFTAILLYLMVVVQFQFWWDVVRVLSLLVVHTAGTVWFKLYSPRLPCRGFGPEKRCREFVYTILIGCWAFSGIILCFAITLGIMAFIPRPVERFPGSEEDEVPPSPSSFKAGSPSDEHRPMSFYSIDSRTGLVTYKNKGQLFEETLSPGPVLSPLDGTYRETITVGPPRLWQRSQTPSPRHINHTSAYDGTTSVRNTPRDRASAISRSHSFHLSPFLDPTSPPVSINSQASIVRTGIGGEKSPITEDVSFWSSASPGLPHGALSPLSLIPHRHPPSPVAMQRDHSAENTPMLYSALKGTPQVEKTYPDRTQMATPGAHSLHSTAGSVHSKWAAPTPHVRLPPALTPGAICFQGPNALLGPNDPSSTYNAPFGTWRLNTAPKRQVSEPARTVRRFGGGTAHQSRHPSINEGSFPRRGSDGEAPDRTQWQQLVLSAAAKP